MYSLITSHIAITYAILASDISTYQAAEDGEGV